MKNRKYRKSRGFTLIEIVVGIFVFMVVFFSIFSVVQTAIRAISDGQNKVVGTAVATGEIERIRNLPYGSLGIVGGFPVGTLPATESKTVDGRAYIVEYSVEYVIDPLDGIGLPQDECPNDYKRVRIKVSWQKPFPGSTVLVTDIVPANLSQECEGVGGVLSVSAFDSHGDMVASPLIEIKDSTTEEVLKTASPASGQHYFSLPPGVYKVFVSKDGYSSERTYGISEIATPTNPDPIILEDQVTQTSLAIDKLSSILISTFVPWAVSDFDDSFENQNKVSQLSNTAIIDSAVVLQQENGSYLASGDVISTPVAPSSLLRWNEFVWQSDLPSQTSIRCQVLYLAETEWTLIPDEDLPGNSSGFFLSPLDLSSLSISAYPKIKLKAVFSTDDSQSTPALNEWVVSWRSSGGTLLPNISFSMRGAKKIGTDAGENPVYKYLSNLSSGAGGAVSRPSIEWDSYNFYSAQSGLNLVSTDPSPQPISVSPDTSLQTSLYFEAQDSLLIIVKNQNDGTPVFSATVRAYNSADDKTQNTDIAGQTYFAPLNSGSHTVDIQAPGFNSSSQSVFVSGNEVQVVQLQPEE